MIFTRFLFIFLCCFGLSFTAFTQPGSNSDLKSRFKDAEYDFSQDDYYLALSKYAYCVRYDSLNANVNFCVGVCYMKTEFEKIKAIPYLERAVKNVTKDYKDGTFDEKKARIEAFLYLGQAYRINKNFEKAIESFNSYKKLLAPDDKKNIVLTDQETESCKNAKKAVENPTGSFVRTNIFEINTAFSDYNAVFSSDENMVIYASSQLEGKSNDEKNILFSKKIDGKFMEPFDITEGLKSKGNMAPSCLSPDGKYLLLVENEDTKTGIYESKLIPTKTKSGRDTLTWTAAKKLNANINKGKVTHASVSPDGKILFFTSDRKEGLGGLDIYKSEKGANNDWGPAVNLGPKINTPFDEETPFLLNDKTLYFSSEGHSSIGGLDIFYSKSDDKGEWSAPVNLGYNRNTTGDNYFYVPLLDGNSGFISLTGIDATGEKDIYKVIIGPFKEEVIELADQQIEVKPDDTQQKKDTVKKVDVVQKTDVKTDIKTDIKTDVKTDQKQDVKNSSAFSPKYSIQIAASTKEENPVFFIGLKGVKEIKCKDGWVRYYFGDFQDCKSAYNQLEKVRNAGFKSAFIADYSKYSEKYIGASCTINDMDSKIKEQVPGFFAIQIASSKAQVDLSLFKNITDVKSKFTGNGYYRYYYGKFEGYTKALSGLNKVKSFGYSDALIINSPD